MHSILHEGSVGVEYSAEGQSICSTCSRESYRLWRSEEAGPHIPYALNHLRIMWMFFLIKLQLFKNIFHLYPLMTHSEWLQQLLSLTLLEKQSPNKQKSPPQKPAWSNSSSRTLERKCEISDLLHTGVLSALQWHPDLTSPRLTAVQCVHNVSPWISVQIPHASNRRFIR